MRCQDILDKIEARYPRKYACDWDNVGLLAGSREREVDTVYIALDATDEVVDAASECGAQLLLTHHPMIFGGLKSVTHVVMRSLSIQTYNNDDVCLKRERSHDHV